MADESPFVTYWQAGNRYNLTIGEFMVRHNNKRPSLGYIFYQGPEKAKIEVVALDEAQQVCTIEVTAIERYPWEEADE